MKIVLLCEGETESALKEPLKDHLDKQCELAQIPRVGLTIMAFDGPATNCREVKTRLETHALNPKVLGVVVLSDVYPDFADAAETKTYLRNCVAKSSAKHMFYAHAAQFDFEAWLLPYWERIAKGLKVKAKLPGSDPEKVNSQKPPSEHLKELYAKAHKHYQKTTEANRIFSRYGIEEAVEKCSELQALVSTLIDLCKKASS